MPSYQVTTTENTASKMENNKHGFFEKYGESLKTCILPIRCVKKNKENLPNSNLGLFSFVSLGWMSKIMWNASRHGINKEDVKKVNQKDGVDVNCKKLAQLWTDELERKGVQKASFSRTVWRFNRTRLTIAGIMMVITCILQFVGTAWVLKSFLDYLEDDSLPMWYGGILIILLSVTQFLKNITYNSMWVIGAHAGVRVQAAIQMLVYNKILTTKMCGDKLLSKVVNYCTTDIERIYQSMQLSMLIAGAPIMWLMNLVYCYMIMGPWSLFGNIIILMFYPIMGMVAKKTSQYRIQSVKLTDSRISLMSQVVSSIKLIKMYAWEDSFSDRIQEIRSKEESVLSKAAFLQSFIWSATPIVVIVGPLVGFIGKVLCGDNLTSSVAFTVIAVFSSLQLPLYTLPIAVKAVSEGTVSCRRIQNMLLFTDATPPSDKGIRNVTNAVSIVEANLAWPTIPDETVYNQNRSSKNKSGSMKTERICDEVVTSRSEATLYHSRDSVNSTDEKPKTTQREFAMAARNINLTIRKGSLIGICGNVGSGKTTLLAGISGEAAIVKGEVSIRGSVALATQQAWIFNATLRDNITFGLDFDETWYKTVVEACCLTTDFTLMPNGDMTEIGEKGANLSGGQKQRVNLARVLYSNRDVYLLDDTLSAVDVKVGRHIFNNCIKKAMLGKTVLLVTHAIHHLEQCDYILLMKDGEIIERGTHSQLISLEGEYCQMFLTDKAQRESQITSNKTSTTDVPNEEAVPDEGPMVDTGMIRDEIDQCNSITWKTCLYFSKACGGYFITFLAFLTIVLFNTIVIFNSVWLQMWLDAGDGNITRSTNTSKNNSIIMSFDNENMQESNEEDGNVRQNPEFLMYVLVYGMSAVILIVSGFLKALTVGRVMLKGASKLHNNMFCKVIRSPMEFFDTTPLARIVNRFSRDIDEMDVQIPFQTEYVSQSMMLIVFQIILIGVLFPVYFVGVAVILIIYITMDLCLNGAVRETKRMDNLLRPSVLVHISATVQGLPIIRCFMKQKMFIDKFRALVNKHLSAFLVFQLSSKWLSFRVDLLSWATVTITALTILLLKGKVSPGTAGLALSQIFRVCSVLAVVTRWKSELLARMISIERVTHYCKNLPEEAPAIVAENRPTPEWPTAGSISFNDVHLRYRPDLPNVLHGLTVNIKGGEKVGIIGRTGEGKSSVIGALMRLNELSGGSIAIDGVDISTIGLKDLRSNISVIPQEPVLFEGTIRWNLDPFKKYNDEEIWASLEKAHLKNKVRREPKGLETQLTAEGGSFSLGEKQLFCLGRALLRNSKILLLDEATASVDVETDNLIQETIRQAFSHCTVLTIAHRLNTITDYEKIMTMDAGKVIEFDTPQNLLSRDSVFNSMMKSMSSNEQ